MRNIPGSMKPQRDARRTPQERATFVLNVGFEVLRAVAVKGR
jgi:hypothetical protein